MTLPIGSIKRRKIEEFAGEELVRATTQLTPYTASSIAPADTGCAITSAVAPNLAPAQSHLQPKLTSPQAYSKSQTNDIHAAVQMLLCKLIDEQGAHTLTQEDLFKQVKEWLKIAEQDFKELNQGHRSHASANRIVSLVQKAVESFGLILAGVFTAAVTGNIPLAAAAIITGGLLLIETIFDDVMKKQVADWMKPITGESQEVWLFRLQMFCSTVAMALGLGVSGVAALELAKNVSSVALSAIRSGIDWRSNSYLKEKLTIDHAMDLAKGLIERLTQGISGNCEKLSKLMKIAAEIAKMRTQTSQTIIQV